MSFVQFVNVQEIKDSRGDIQIFEEFKNVPFDIKRIYCLTNMQGKPKGFHAHKNLQQVAVCLSGSCTFILDNGHEREEVVLSQPNQGLLIQSMVWREIKKFSDGCVIMVLASEHYDEDDYIRDYNDFKIRAQKTD